MRRFVRTFFVRRVGQYTVIQDSDTREFEVWSYTATAGLTAAGRYPYADPRYLPGDLADERTVRETAVRAAKALADTALRAGDGAALERQPDAKHDEPAIPASVVDTTAEALGLGRRNNGRGGRS